MGLSAAIYCPKPTVSDLCDLFFLDSAAFLAVDYLNYLGGSVEQVKLPFLEGSLTKTLRQKTSLMATWAAWRRRFRLRLFHEMFWT